MGKAPFERVFSLIERKKLLRRVAKDKIRVLIKSTKNEVAEFKVLRIDAEANLEGELVGANFRDFDKVTALFYVDKDRYFMTTRLKRKEESWILLNDAQFFKFNRRSAFRVAIPENLDFSFFVMNVRNIEINRKVPVVEFSSGGARLQWFSTKKLANGTHLKGALQWGRGKVLPVEGVVVHAPSPSIFAIRFINLSTVTINRLKMLSVEIQREVYFV